MTVSGSLLRDPMVSRRGLNVWPEIIARAAEIVNEYNDAGTGVTLRQLFYRLVAAGILKNTAPEYMQLSEKTAAARRDDGFPALLDNNRTLHRYRTFDGPAEAREYIADAYRRDRTEGQPRQLYIVAEKATMVQQLRNWFGELGVPIVACGGYASQTLIDDIRNDMDGEDSKRDEPSRIIYAGDLDPTGEDIPRVLRDRLGIDDIVQIAVTPEQVEQYGLVEAPGKAKDPRAAGFIAKHGKLIQVELEALEPETLRGLYQAEIDKSWDAAAYRRAIIEEHEERLELRNGGNGTSPEPDDDEDDEPDGYDKYDKPSEAK